MGQKIKTRKETACGEGCIRILVYIYIVTIFILGLGCLGIGIWMEADPYVKSYFIVLQRSVTDDVLVSAPPIFITCGLILIGIGVCGCYGAISSNKLVFGLFAFLVFVILVMMLTIGFLVVKFNDDIHKRLKEGMQKQIQDEYLFDNDVGKAWNLIQVRHKCCGAEDSYDYYGSMWYNQENADAIANLETSAWYVPETCCVLDFNQDRDPSHVNPQEPQPKDVKRCQEDAEGRKDGSEYLHGRGCYARLVIDFIYHHVDTLMAVGITTGIMGLLGFLGVVYLLRVME